MFNTYSPADVIVTWSGITVTGFAEDTFVEMTREEDVLARYRGADGTLTLSKNANLGGDITITLSANSPSNKLLAAAAFAQERAGAEVPISNFTITDPSGGVLAVAVNAFLITLPSIELGKEVGERTWVWGCETMLFNDDLASATAAIGDFLPKGLSLAGL